MTSDLEREVIEIIARQNGIDPSRVTAASTFEELGLNSLAAIELLFAVEEQFGVTIPDETTQSMVSFRQACVN